MIATISKNSNKFRYKVTVGWRNMPSTRSYDIIGVGFEDEFSRVKDDIDDALNFEDANVGINASIRKVGAGAAGGAFGGTSIGNININIDGAKYSYEQSLASAIALEIQNMTDRRAAVYA